MTQELTNSKWKDSSSKIIFEDPILCAQFLRGYVDVPILKDVQPEDIEDVTNRFVHMFTEERNSDVVKKVCRKEEDTPCYLISLIEHKSDVDYNVIMQVFRYMVFIWEDYEKEMEKKHPGISKTKGFKYPPILPIVFYDGVDKWTAATRLHDRVFLSDILGKYIPDYQCILVQLKNYSNGELKKKKDELSIIMLIDKLRSATEFAGISKEVNAKYLSDATLGTPEYLLGIMVQIVEVFLSRLNVPVDEVESFTGQIKERGMGELFKHFQGYDVQAVRKQVRKEEHDKTVEEDIKILVKAFRDVGVSKEMAKNQLMEKYCLEENVANEKIEMYWKEEIKK